jgi:hypothetical protein
MENSATCCSTLGACNRLPDTVEQKEGLQCRWSEFWAQCPILKTDNLPRPTAVHNVLILGKLDKEM